MDADDRREVRSTGTTARRDREREVWLGGDHVCDGVPAKGEEKIRSDVHGAEGGRRVVEVA